MVAHRGTWPAVHCEPHEECPVVTWKSAAQLPVHEVLPSGEVLLPVHCWQEVEEVLAVPMVRYLPAVHFVQAALAVFSEYWPSGHVRQAVFWVSV